MDGRAEWCFCEVSVSICRHSPAALCVRLCVGLRHSLCQCPPLSVSGPGAPRRSLCRGPALANALCAGPLALCVGPISGSNGFCVRTVGARVGPRRSLCRGPALSGRGGVVRRSPAANCVGPSPALSVSRPGALCVIGPWRSLCRAPRRFHLVRGLPAHMPPIRSADPVQGAAGPICMPSPQLRSTCYPSVAPATHPVLQTI